MTEEAPKKKKSRYRPVGARSPKPIKTEGERIRREKIRAYRLGRRHTEATIRKQKETIANKSPEEKADIAAKNAKNGKIGGLVKKGRMYRPYLERKVQSDRNNNAHNNAIIQKKRELEHTSDMIEFDDDSPFG